MSKHWADVPSKMALANGLPFSIVFQLYVSADLFYRLGNSQAG